MIHIGKGKLFNSEADKLGALRQAIVREDTNAVKELIANGLEIPEFLYMRVTNHDHDY